MVNFGTTFGMGIIMTGGIMGIASGKYATSVLIGTICAIIGGVFSVRILMRFTKNYLERKKKSHKNIFHQKLPTSNPAIEKHVKELLFNVD